MIRSSLAHLHIAALSHPGMSGKNNEDRYALSSYMLEGGWMADVPLVIAAIDLDDLMQVDEACINKRGGGRSGSHRLHSEARSRIEEVQGASL